MRVMRGSEFPSVPSTYFLPTCFLPKRRCSPLPERQTQPQAPHANQAASIAVIGNDERAFWPDSSSLAV